jgi:hypothetical protein
MNSAVIKYNKISSSNDGSFSGAGTTRQENIVAMVAAVKRKAPTPAPAAARAKPTPRPSAPDAKGHKQPPFLRHFKSSTSSGSVTYKVGNTKPFYGATWYFCDCPNHRDRIKWHTHAAADCCTHINWLSNKTSGPPIANAA